MNKWQLTAVILKEPIRSQVGAHRVLNFTVMHTDTRKRSDNSADPAEVTHIDCAFWNPPDKIVEQFQAGALVYLVGRPNVRHIKRKDDSKDDFLQMRIHFGRKWKEGDEDGSEATLEELEAELKELRRQHQRRGPYRPRH